MCVRRIRIRERILENSIQSAPASAVSGLSAISLANILDQSIDCVKLISIDGAIQYINANGQCALEIDDFCAIKGLAWVSMWPEAAHQRIHDSYIEATAGGFAKFRAYCPTAKGASRWWDVSVSPVTDNNGQIAGFLAVSRDVAENQASREALTIAASELKHRLKNTYQMIGSLLVLTSRGNAVNEEFALQMAARLGAISRAQTLFADSEAPCDLEQLIPMLVSPFGNEACLVTYGALPAVMLDQPQADAIALVVGELAVNSSKHGALAHGGKILVDAIQEKDLITIVWNERCDRLVQQHSREGGQGMALMGRIMRTRSGNLDIEWQAKGLVATLSFKLAA